MPKLVWLNGEVMPAEKAVTSVADHAFLYGDGLFEGIRFYGRKVFKLDEHLKRLYTGIKYLGFQMPMDAPALKKQILDVCAQTGLSNGYIRLNVTRGSGLGLDPNHIDRKANVMIWVSDIALYPAEAYEKGLNVVTASFRVIPADVLDPKIKCIGRYASNILAKEEANRAGAGEALMLNAQGYVAEATGDNLFLIKDGRIITPHPTTGLLLGITRATVIGLAKEAGYTVTEEFISRFEVMASDEAFLTGTAAEVIPMVNLDGQPIGDGKPGPITKQLIAKFHGITGTGDAF